MVVTPYESLDALTGTMVADKYRLVSVLGSGGAGYVYQAEQLDLHRSVAIKLLRPERVTKDFERFHAEARAASSINHPNAIAVYDFGVTDDGLPYIVMEHLRGRTLTSVVEDETLGLDRIVNIAAQILSALEEAHERGIVHRDLKSDNIILEPLRNGDDFVKVIDFGLARFADSLVAERGIWGTPEYMAPEQIRGEAVGPAADLYSVGVVLYEMIVGRTPFAAANVGVVLEGHQRAVPVAPAEVVALCPAALSDLVMWALAKAPGARPGNAARMRADLLAVLDQDGTRECANCGQVNGGRFRFCGQCGAVLSGPPVEPLRALRQPLGERPTEGMRTTNLVRAADPLASLIGREQDLDRLLQFYRGVASSGTMAILGPTGIGKSRLLFEVARAGEVATFFTGADPSGLATAWYPVLSMLEAVLEVDAGPSYTELAAAVARCGLPERDAPGLAELFAIQGPLESVELAVRRREATAAALRALRTVDRRHPGAVLCFADIDRYDRPSIEFIAALSEALEGTAVRLILTSRDSAVIPPTADTMSLSLLSPEHGYELAIELAGSAEGLPDRATIHAVTEGLPAAIAQLVAWVGREHDADQAPTDFVDLLGAMVCRLPAVARRVLQCVAIHGTSVSRTLLAATHGEMDAAVYGGLDDLAGAELLVLGSDDVSIPCELIAEVVIACTPAGIRRELHARALAALDRGEQLVSSSVVAYHAENAGDFARAYVQMMEAGDDAVRRFDDHGGVEWYGRAVAASRVLFGRGEGQAQELLVNASVKLADVLRYTGQLGLAAGTLDEAALVQTEPVELAAISRCRGRLDVVLGELESACRHFHRAIGAALRGGDRGFVCETYVDLARAMAQRGLVTRAAAELTEAIDILTLGQGLEVETEVNRLWYLGFRLAELQLRAGDLATAERTASAALPHAERSSSAQGRGRLYALLAEIVAAQGRRREALAHRARAIEELRDIGDRRSTAELLLENARATRDLDPLAAGAVSDRTALRATEIAGELAAEIGWDDGTALATAALPVAIQ